ncbi:MAG TPA: alkaline phosphatase D family protein [Candidatus Binatia bacterium]|jgi:alkaline phosphatase D
MNRRGFFRVLGGAGLTASALLGKSGCAPALVRSDADSGLSLGYVAGEVTHESALIWLRTEPRSQVALQYSTDPDFRQFSLTGQFSVESDADFTAKISLDKLQAATRYDYRAAVAGKTPGQIASFITAPGPADETKVSFCFSGDTRESYKPFTVMSAVRAQRPDFFLYLGDTIYADRNGAARQLQDFWWKYRNNRDDAASQYCFRDTSVYAVWDDHEVEDNYLPSHPLAPIGRKAFLDYWPIRCPSAEPERIFRSFRWGKSAELFILDVRQYRDLKRGSMLGKTQKEWFFDSIAASQAKFKFVATTVPMAGGGSDRWDGYSDEREKILRHLSGKRIRGVVFLSADMHYAAITKIPRSNGLIDITAGPLAAPLNRITNGTAARFEYFLAENFNFAKITVDPKVEPTKALVEFIDQDNQVFHTAKINAG